MAQAEARLILSCHNQILKVIYNKKFIMSDKFWETEYLGIIKQNETKPTKSVQYKVKLVQLYMKMQQNGTLLEQNQIDNLNKYKKECEQMESLYTKLQKRKLDGTAWNKTFQIQLDELTLTFEFFSMQNVASGEALRQQQKSSTPGMDAFIQQHGSSTHGHDAWIQHIKDEEIRHSERRKCLDQQFKWDCDILRNMVPMCCDSQVFATNNKRRWLVNECEYCSKKFESGDLYIMPRLKSNPDLFLPKSCESGGSMCIQCFDKSKKWRLETIRDSNCRNSIGGSYETRGGGEDTVMWTTYIYKPQNDDGNYVLTGRDKETYYCGQRRLIPGSDGQCGRNDGPQCSSCKTFQNMLKELVTKHDHSHMKTPKEIEKWENGHINLEEWLQTKDIPEFFGRILEQEAWITTLDSLKACVCKFEWTTAEQWNNLLYDCEGKLLGQREFQTIRRKFRAFEKFIHAIQSLKVDSTQFGSKPHWLDENWKNDFKELEKWLEKNNIPVFFARILVEKALVDSLSKLKERACLHTLQDWKKMMHGLKSTDAIKNKNLADAFEKFINATQSLKSDCVIMGSGNPYIVKFS